MWLYQWCQLLIVGNEKFDHLHTVRSRLVHTCQRAMKSVRSTHGQRVFLTIAIQARSCQIKLAQITLGMESEMYRDAMMIV